MFIVPLAFIAQESDKPHVELVHTNPSIYQHITDRSFAFNPAAANGLTSVSAFSISFKVSFNSDDSGILFESGGSGIGVLIYVYQKYLYIQCGSGSSYQASGQYELAYPLEVNSQTTTYTNKHIDISFEKGKYIILYIDHQIKSFITLPYVTITGTNGAGIGRIHGDTYIGGDNNYYSVANNAGGWSNPTDINCEFTGTIYYANIYLGVSFSQYILELTVSNTNKTYNGSTQSLNIATSNNSVSYLVGSNPGSGPQTHGEINADTYNISLSSNDSDYLTNLSSTTLIIDKAMLNFSFIGNETQEFNNTNRTRVVDPNNDSVSYLFNGSPVTGNQTITRSSVGTTQRTITSNDSNYNVSETIAKLIIEQSSYTYFKFVFPASGETRVDYIKFQTASNSTVSTALHAYSPTTLSKWRRGNAPNGPHQESNEGWFTRNEEHHYVFRQTGSGDITKYDLKMVSHGNRMPQKWMIYGSNSNGNWQHIRTVPSSGTFNEGNNNGSNSTGLRWHYQNGKKWFNSEVRPNNSGNGYIGSLSSSDFNL